MGMRIDGKIVPGKRIGAISLDMCIEEVCKALGEYSIQKRANCTVVHGYMISIWFSDVDGKATQILVHDQYKGKFANCIMIGDSLSKVREVTGSSVYEDLDTYKLDTIPGIGFELTDDEDDAIEWNLETAPIATIFIFPIS